MSFAQAVDVSHAPGASETNPAAQSACEHSLGIASSRGVCQS
jgi:hypothetical protein